MYSNRRGAKSRRDERKRRRWRGKRRESRRREESEELKISHPVVYTERPAASTCRTGCYLPPCYSRARAKLINGKVEALNAPRISARVLPSRFVSRRCSKSNGGKVSMFIFAYGKMQHCNMERNIFLSSIFRVYNFWIINFKKIEKWHANLSSI